MKHWIGAVCLVTATACQTTLPTSSVEQALEDCVPGGNYAGAKMPAMSIWQGQALPKAGPGQLYMDNPDPYVQGRHWGVLADPDKGEIVFAVIVNDQNLTYYRGQAAAASNGSHPMINDCCRPPPPPIGGGEEFQARRFLEAALRYRDVQVFAAEAAGPPYYP